MLILIDNYDSFTYNLVHFLGELGAQSVVVRNDKVTAAEVMSEKPKAIVLSPRMGDFNDDLRFSGLDMLRASIADQLMRRDRIRYLARAL